MPDRRVAATAANVSHVACFGCHKFAQQLRDACVIMRAELKFSGALPRFQSLPATFSGRMAAAQGATQACEKPQNGAISSGPEPPGTCCPSAFECPSDGRRSCSRGPRVDRTVARAGGGDHEQGAVEWADCEFQDHARSMPMAPSFRDRRHEAVVVMGWLSGAPSSR
jgi:hypothetical protein